MINIKNAKCKKGYHEGGMPNIFSKEWDSWDKKYNTQYFILYFDNSIKVESAGRCVHSAISRTCVNTHVCGNVIGYDYQERYMEPNE